MKTTEQKHAELKALGRQHRRSTYEMLALAHEILEDPAYCEQFGGQSALQDHLEATDFVHFGGKPTLANMLRAYRKNPNRSVWDEYQHNIWAMIDLSAPTKNTEAKEKINWKALAKELEVKVEMLEAELDQIRDRYEKALTKIGQSHLA